jgi:hypothetical protein
MTTLAALREKQTRLTLERTQRDRLTTCQLEPYDPASGTEYTMSAPYGEGDFVVVFRSPQ